jgi:hypothetical protein
MLPPKQISPSITVSGTKNYWVEMDFPPIFWGTTAPISYSTSVVWETITISGELERLIFWKQLPNPMFPYYESNLRRLYAKQGKRGVYERISDVAEMYIESLYSRMYV